MIIRCISGEGEGNFTEELVPDEENKELSREEVLQMNKIHHRFTRQQIESFIEERMTDGVLETGSLQLTCQEDFEKLILAYDICMRKNSRFQVVTSGEQVEGERYTYPAMMFVERKRSGSAGLTDKRKGKEMLPYINELSQEEQEKLQEMIRSSSARLSPGEKIR